VYCVEEGISQLYVPHLPVEGTQRNLTEEVREFYEETPFPNYDEFDSLSSLIAKARNGIFAKMLDDQVPLNAKIVECGSGTSQLSNFLAAKGREVVAADLCLNSLRLGKQFAQQNRIDSVNFVQMNLFKPAVKRNAFDLVISNGVLHHTQDPEGAFRSIASLVRPGGYIIVGLYHYWGRLITDMRRVVFRATNQRLISLDPNLRGTDASTPKARAWFADQYAHPHESKHTIRECLQWYERTGIEFTKSIPSTHLFRDFSENESLFHAEQPANAIEALLKEMSFFRNGSREGGFFTMIGRKVA